MQIILLERVEKLGALGDLVNVKSGYARNFLLQTGKALRATKANVKNFETQKAALQSANEERKTVANVLADKIEGTVIVLIRSASDSGHLYGSVTTRDIAASLSEKLGESFTRNNVILQHPVKSIGFFDFKIKVHSEVNAKISVNVAQSAEEAQDQHDRVKRGESAVVTAAQEDAKIAAEIALEQSKQLKRIADDVALEGENQLDASSHSTDSSETADSSSENTDEKTTTSE